MRRKPAVHPELADGTSSQFFISAILRVRKRCCTPGTPHNLIDNEPQAVDDVVDRARDAVMDLAVWLRSLGLEQG